jgi:NADH:ubiquinone oxidoreductase subunit 5 (subunit L)/multisubunit Na+/H+ antiporter MnhA subunit
VADTNAFGIFHLFTHAFFKALLFLGSGSVIHAVANQDMRKMGGLARRMPITAATFLVATLSISGIPGLAGFFSKDAIIALAFDAGPTIWGGYTLYIFTLTAAVLTAFYMFRLYFMTFGGPGAGILGLWGGDAQYRGDQPAHESPWTMSLPLLILAVPAALAGYVAFVGFFPYLNGGQPVPYGNPFADGLTYVGVGAALVGIVIAWLMYGRRSNLAAWYKRVPGGTFAYNVLAHKYYLDELYLWLVKWIILGLSQLAVLFDLHVIDGVIHGTRDFVLGLGNVTSHSETGRLQNYAAVFFGGALVLLIALIVAAAVLVAR